MGSSTTTPHVSGRGALCFAEPGHAQYVALATLLTGFCLVGMAPAASALDTRVDAATVYQAYEVGVPRSRTSWTRRRFSQRLALELSSDIGGANGGEHPPPRLAGSFDLRLLQEFGDVCVDSSGERRCFSVTSPALGGRYVPVANDSRLQLRTASVSLSGGPLETVGQIGRQLYLDPIGMLRTDGLSIHLRPIDFIAIKMVAGALVRGTSLAGSDAFGGVGVARAPTSAKAVADQGWLDDAPTTWLSGVGAVVGREKWMQGSAFFRDLRDRTGALQRSFSVGFKSSPGNGVGLASSAIFDGFSWDVVRGRIEVSWAGALGSLKLRGTRELPRYDYASIWLFFNPAATWGGELSYETSVGMRSLVGARVRTRLMEPPHGAGLWDAGGDVFVSSSEGRLEWDMRASLIAGDNPFLYAVDGGASYRVGHGVVAYGRAGARRVVAAFAEGLPGVSLAQQVGVTFPVEDVTEGKIELAHASGGGVRHRFTLNAVLQLRILR